VPDHLEELFADLRVATLPQVRPPGTAAARRTVKRRRTTRTVAAAAVVFAVAGGLAVAEPAVRGGHRETPAERLKELAGTAKQAIGAQQPELVTGALTGTVTAGSTQTFADRPAGSYTLTLACAGAGRVTVEARLVRSADDNAVLGGYVVACAEAPRAVALTFRVPLDGSVVVSVTGDDTAMDSAGYAVGLGADDGTQDSAPRQQDAPAPESTWNATRAAQVLTATGRQTPVQVTTERTLSTMQFTGPGMTSKPGDYELLLTCAGPGTLSLTVHTVSTGAGQIADNGETVLQRQVECRDTDPRLDPADLLTLPRDHGFLITAVPDAQARNRAGWAYLLDPA
jgi:hypothetical protein